MEEARKLGLGRLLLTCNARNIASRRVILANGGVLEDEIIEHDGGERIVV